MSATAKVSSQDMTGEGFTSELTYMFVGRIQSFAGCWLEVASVACHAGPPNITGSLIKATKRESAAIKIDVAESLE